MKKRVLFILAFLWAFVSFFTIKYTYAKYLSALSSNNNVEIASWNMLLNNQDITSNSDISSVLELIIPETQYYLTNSLVPNAIGYFDINLNTTNVSIPFKYSITCSKTQNNYIDDIAVIGYSLNSQNGQITYIQNGNDVIETTVNAEDTSSFLRIYVQWLEDNQSAVLNDINDTNLALASSNNNASIYVQAHFEQINSNQNTNSNTSTNTNTNTN